MATHSISRSGGSITINGITDEVPGKYVLSVDALNSILIVKSEEGVVKVEIHTTTDTVTVNEEAFEGTASELKTLLLSDVFASASGGSEPTEVAILQAKTVLTDAQIKTLPTAPVELVPAPGANKVVRVIEILVGPVDDSNGGYTNTKNDNSAYLEGIYGVGYDADASEVKPNPNQVFTTEPSLGIIYPMVGVGFRSDTVFTGSNTINKGIFLMCENGELGNFTGGGSGNSMPVTVIYYIVDVA